MPSDIRLENIIFEQTPPWTHPYIKLARLDRPVGTWLLLLPCWWAVVLANQGLFGMDGRAWLHMELFACGALLMRSAGCVVNDLWDADLDAKVERTKTRPLASGEITRESAIRFLVALLLPAFIILLCLGKAAIVLGILSLPLVVAYPYMKRVTWWPQAFLGLTFNWGALMGFAAADGTLSPPAFLLYIGGFGWTLAYDTIYAHQDKDDDALVGVRSTARLFGDNSKKFVAAFYALAVVFIAAAKYAAYPSPLMVLMLLPPVWMAFRVVSRWNPDDAASSGAAFRASRIFGWLVLAMAAV